MNKFRPLSPDPFIIKDADMALAKFGHLNAIIDELNATIASLQAGFTNVYATNAAALAGGLTPGTLYRTATGELRIVIPA